jgi:hypothetical protein
MIKYSDSEIKVFEKKYELMAGYVNEIQSLEKNGNKNTHKTKEEYFNGVGHDLKRIEFLNKQINETASSIGRARLNSIDEYLKIFKVQWIDTEVGFKGVTNDIFIVCNIDKNTCKINEIRIDFEYPMPIYDENVMSGLVDGEEIFNINLTGNNEKDIEQLKAAIEKYVKSLPDDF